MTHELHHRDDIIKRLERELETPMDDKRRALIELWLFGWI
jgi:hypothetical protein